MTKTEKVNLLYRKAKGESLSRSQESELKKYKVSCGESSRIVTMNNIKGYVNAVDSGYKLAFNDWCWSNGKGDRRRKNSSAKDLKNEDRSTDLSAVLGVGWLFWAMGLYWFSGGTINVGTSCVISVFLVVILRRLSRNLASFTCIVLPILLIIIGAAR